jgi:multidrug efflux pump subunit AcrA (membrane-fusion protein)
MHRGARMWVAGLVGLVVLAGAAWLVGSRAQSPEQAAARASEPTASYITAKVERRVLTKTVIQRGDVRPEVSLEVGAPSSVDGDPVVTGIAVSQGADVAEGAKLIEVSGRPIFVLQGAVPVYRALRPGMTGADVSQLQAALTRLGFTPDGDGRFGEATKAAVTGFYTAGGYLPIPSSTSFDADLAAAQQALVQADTALKTAQAEVVKAGAAQPNSVIAQAQATVNSAQRAVDDALAKQSTDAVDAQAQLDAANANYARLVNDPSAAPNDVDAAKLAVIQAQSNLSTVTRSDADAVDSAHEALHVAQLALGEAKKTGDQAQAQLAVDSATATRDAAATAVETLVAVNGPTVAQGEIVFMPTMPARVQSAIATLGPLAQPSSTGTPNGGSAGAGGLVSLAGGQLVVTTSIRSSEAGLTRVGTPVELLDENTTTTYSATITTIAEQPSAGTDGQLGFAARITPDQPLPQELSGANLRVTITAASTESKSLVVPLAAVSSSADGSTRVSTVASTNATPVDVPVTAGLSADGFVAVEPTTAGALSEGDLVVVGR